MSELAEEQTATTDELEAEEAPGEPLEGDDADLEPGDDDEGGDDDEAGEEGGELELHADEVRVQTEKELAARDERLVKENIRHAARLEQIMGADAGDLIPCPVCMDGIAGWIYPPDVAPLPDEAIARIRSVVGLPDLTTFERDPDTEPCPVCRGKGETRTGSDVPGYEVRTCPRCKKMGYITHGASLASVPDVAPAEPIVTGPTVYTATEGDPEVDHLRARGFTVIPPIPVAG